MFGDYFYLGKITKVFGLKGELVVYLDTDEPKKYHNLETVFLNISGEPVPFFIESIKIKTANQLIVKFQEIDEKEVASYVNVELYLPLTMLPPLSGNKFYYHEIKGFTIKDLKHGEIGICQTVLEYPNQAVFLIRNGETEILIPIVDAFIKHVDREKRIIEIETPDGLIDIYTKLSPQKNKPNFE